MPAIMLVGPWHPECNFALSVNAMSRRDALPQRSARRSILDLEEVYEDQPTRAARPSVIAPEDLAELAHLDGRENAETRSARPAFVDPLELDAGLGPTRSPRESYVALSELPQMPSSRLAPSPVARISYVATVDLDGEVEEDEVTSFVDRSSMVSASEMDDRGPDSVTTYAVRPSYVARDEQVESLAASDEHPSYATSEIEEIDPADEQNAESGPIDYAALSRFLFDDVAPPRREPAPAAETPDAELYADHGTLLIAPENEAPRSYPRQDAMSVRHDLGPTAEAPVQPLATRRSRVSIHDAEPGPMRRSMPSVFPQDLAPAQHPPQQPVRRSMPSHPPADFAAPSFAPPQPMSSRRSMPSHHAYEAAMQQFAAPQPMSSRRSMPSVHPHDSSASPWVVSSAPSTRRGAVGAPPAPFKITPSVIAAALVALLAVMVMVGGVLFVRSEDRPEPTASAFATTEPTFPSASAVLSPSAPPQAPAAPAVIVISSDDIPVDGEPVVTATTTPVARPLPEPVVQAAPSAATPVAAPIAAAPPPANAQPVAAPIAIAKPAAAAPASTAARAPSTKKADTKAGAKSVEDILAELGEEQLRR